MLINHSNPHLGGLAHPSTLEVLQANERIPTPYPFLVFTFGFVIEYIKQFGCVNKFPQNNNTNAITQFFSQF
jgi:hypothetical protein